MGGVVTRVLPRGGYWFRCMRRVAVRLLGPGRGALARFLCLLGCGFRLLSSGLADGLLEDLKGVDIV